MKMLVILILILGVGVGAYYYATGNLPMVLLSEDEKKVAQIRGTFESARTSIRQSKRAAISGVDTTGMSDGSGAQIDEIRGELMVIKSQLKSDGAKAEALKLQGEIDAFRRELK